MNAAELAAELGCPLVGDAVELRGAAALGEACASDLSFVSDGKSYAEGARSAAGCVIAPPSYAKPPHQSVVHASAPRIAFSRALRLLYPERALYEGVHTTASVEPGVAVASTAEVGPLCAVGADSVIGAHSRLGAGCRIGRAVSIGAHCVLHAGVTVGDGTRIGDRVILHSGCVLGADGFGFTPHEGGWVKFPQVGIVEIEDDVEIGANSCVDRAALGRTRIGAGTKIDNLVHVGHNCDIGRSVVIAAQTGLSGAVVIGDGAVIGGQVGIGDKARVEAGAVVGSGAGILPSKIVRAGQPVWGTPARPLKEHLRQLAEANKLGALRKRIEELERRS